MRFASIILALVIIGHSLLLEFANADDFLTVTVAKQSGEPVENAVISAFAKNLRNHLSVAPNKKTAVIDQIDKEYIAHVTAVQVGTAIDFPNHDQIRHHVYSFSAAKTFEIPLYKGTPATPIIFNKAGVVTLGCNIHDWMSAYIYVLDTPYFTMTDLNGHASLKLPPGEYEIRYWHPNIDEKSGQIRQMIKHESGSAQAVSVQLGLKQVLSLRRGPLSSNSRGRYR